MADLQEFTRLDVGGTRPCDRCEQAVRQGWLALLRGQSFAPVFICDLCRMRQEQRVLDRVATSPDPAPTAAHKHTRSHHKRLFPQLPQGFKIPSAYQPRLAALKKFKKDGPETAYAALWLELYDSFRMNGLDPAYLP